MKVLSFLFLFISILFSEIGYTASGHGKFIRGEGRFYATDDDSLAFLKKQLFFNSFKDVVSKEFKAMGLDEILFWNKFDFKFNDYFDPIKEKLKLKYGFDNKEKMSKLSKKQIKKKKEEYVKKLRHKRLALMARYGRIDRAITSYTKVKMTRSTRYPNTRYMTLQAKVDKKYLNELFYKFTTVGKTRHFDKLYITANFRLENMGWNDVGVEIESDFVKVVKEYWKRWFQDNLGSYIDEIVVTDKDVENKLEDHLKMPSIISDQINLMAASDKGRIIISGGEWVRNSIWLKVNVGIEKNNEDTMMKKREFHFGGDFVLVDLKTNLLISHYDFISETNKYSYQRPHELSSNVASFVYRYPLIKFQELFEKFGGKAVGDNRIAMEIFNLESIQELFILNEIITTRGVTLRLNSSIKSYSGNVGLISLSFNGELERLMIFLKSLENVSISDKKLISFKSRDKPFSIILKRGVKSFKEGKGRNKGKGGKKKSRSAGL